MSERPFGGPFIGTAVVANAGVRTAFVISGLGRNAALAVLMRAGRAAALRLAKWLEPLGGRR